MICGDCQEAGKFNAAALKPQPRMPKGSEGLLIQAQMWHNKCKGGTWCDCQHVVGQKAIAGLEAR